MPGPVASTSTLPASPVAAPKTTRSKGKGRSSLVAEEASTSANTPVADSTPRKPRMKKADVLLGKEARALKAAEIVEASASAPAEVEEREERRPRMKKGDSRLPKRPASHFPKLKDLEEAEPEVEERDGIPRWGCSTLVSGGPPPATLPPVFSKDASHFFLAASSSIRVHSALTSQAVSTLSSPTSPSSHRAAISAFLINPSNPLQLVTASLDGTIKIWDFIDATLLRTITIGRPITHLTVATEGPLKGTWFAAASYFKDTKTGGHAGLQSIVYRVSLKATTDASKPFARLGKIRPTSSLMVSPSGSYLVAIATTKAYCLRLASVKTGFKKFVSPVELTCGAFHPTEDWFVTGDVRGIVRLWYCLSDEGVKGDEVVGSSKSQGGLRKTPTTTLHWHSHAVSSIAFNSSGTSILSGGQEAVVVIWSVATSGKEFVPRVGGEISALAVRPPAEGREEEIWAGLKDGSVKRLGADGRGGRTIKGGFESSRIQPFTASPSNQHVPIAYHGPTSSLLLPASHPSSLQLYSSTLQTALLELEVAPSNRVSAFADKPIESAHVDRAVLSRDEGSEWLATAESREADEEEGGLEERAIKVWRWDADAKTYSLTTRLPEPHTSRITSLGFSPVPVTLAPTDKQGSLLLLSTSEEGTARLWKEKRIRFKTGRVEAFFQPHTLFSHHGLPIRDSAWAPDASLLALAHGSVVSVWDPITSELRGSLASPRSRPITRVSFVGGEGRWVVGTGERKGVVVWDLLKGTVAWSDDHRVVDGLSVDPSSSSPLFTITETTYQPTASTAFHIFSVTSSTPLRQHFVPHRLRSFVPYTSIEPTSSYASTSTAESHTQLSFLAVTVDYDVVLIGDGVEKTIYAADSAQALNLSATLTSRTLFDEIFGDSSSAFTPPQLAAARPELLAAAQRKSLDSLFDAPAQVLPGMGLVFYEVLDSLLARRGAVEETDDLVEEDMDMDEAVVVLGDADAGKIRPVTDTDVDELTSLFGDILSSSSPIPPSSKLNGKTTPVALSTPSRGAAGANGLSRSTPNGIPASASKLTPAGLTQKKTRTSLAASTADDVSMDDTLSTVSASPSVGGSARKRKTQ